MSKKCTKCGITKDESEFYNDRKGKNGLSSRCKKCSLKHSKEYKKKNQQATTAYKKRYYREHKKEIAAFKKKFYLKHKDKIKAYQKKYYEGKKKKKT